MPVLIVVFAVGAYGYGAVLRGSDVVVNEVAHRPRRAGRHRGTAQVYIGVFSPSRAPTRFGVPGGALLSSPISGDFFGGDGTASTLDILQGDPAQVRDLAVGFGSLRTIRAETAVAVPRIQADLGLVDGRLTGHGQERLRPRPREAGGRPRRDRWQSSMTSRPARQASVDSPWRRSDPFGQPLSDQVVGRSSSATRAVTADMTDLYIRHTMIDQLTYDPNWARRRRCRPTGRSCSRGAPAACSPSRSSARAARHSATSCTTSRPTWRSSGETTFRGDLLRSTIDRSDAAFFSKDPSTINFGKGSATLAYRPIAVRGDVRPERARDRPRTSGATSDRVPPVKPIEPLPGDPGAVHGSDRPEAARSRVDGLPEVELFDLTSQDWVRLPHLDGGAHATRSPIRRATSTRPRASSSSASSTTAATG